MQEFALAQQAFDRAEQAELTPIAVDRQSRPFRRNRQRSQPHNTIAGETSHCNQKEPVSVPNANTPPPWFHSKSKAWGIIVTTGPKSQTSSKNSPRQ
jgi:hypothetical protein